MGMKKPASVIDERGFMALFYFGAQRFFAAEANLSRFIDFQNLDHDFVAFLQDIRHFGNALLGNLRDMQ
jgi:hypothetical protein